MTEAVRCAGDGAAAVHGTALRPLQRTSSRLSRRCGPRLEWQPVRDYHLRHRERHLQAVAHDADPNGPAPVPWAEWNAAARGLLEGPGG